jgi:hypothetical protein
MAIFVGTMGWIKEEASMEGRSKRGMEEQAGMEEGEIEIKNKVFQKISW